MAISDVVLRNGWYTTLDSNNKKIDEKSENSIGELLGFSSELMVFKKSGWYVVYDERFKKIDVHICFVHRHR